MPHNSSDPLHFRSAAELETLVRRFEACTLAPAEFTHRAHLAVALWYLAHAAQTEAAAQMRAGLLRFIAHNHVEPQKYNETITLFWLKLVAHFRAHAGAARPLAEVANELLARFGDAQLLYKHYSRALLKTQAAKATWVGPDLRPLGFE
jgi:hypothetical protein